MCSSFMECPSRSHEDMSLWAASAYRKKGDPKKLVSEYSADSRGFARARVFRGVAFWDRATVSEAILGQNKVLFLLISVSKIH